MSDHYATWIRIGGILKRRQAAFFLEVLRAQGTGLEWGEAPVAPHTIEELLSVLRDGRLWLCDDRATDGAFPELEAACRKLRLSYTRHTESGCGFDAERVDWRPGMRRPLLRIGSNVNSSETLVPAYALTRVIRDLERGRVEWALAALQKLCPALPEVPPLIVG